MQKSSIAAARRLGAYILVAAATILTAGCGGGGDGDSSSASSSAGEAPAAMANAAPTISGQPSTQAAVGDPYALELAAADSDGDPLAFSIDNRPEWASFNTATGKLSGTPTAGDVGVTEHIVISVSDGKSSAALPAFSITVDPSAPTTPSGTVILAWEIPTHTVSGANLGDLQGYRIHYGASSKALTDAIEITSPGVNSYTLSDLTPGTYYFSIRAVSAGGQQSLPSNIVKRVVS